MSLSAMSPFKRLLGGVAVAALAVTLAACSDEKKETAAAPENQATTESAATQPAPAAGADVASTPAAAPAATTETAQTESAQTAPSAGTTQSTPASAEVPPSEGDVDMAKVLEPGPLPEMAIGEANAPVTIVEYMSMTCPHCAKFHNETFDAIKAKYVDSGQVRFILREFPFDPRAAAAFMLARCAPPEQYFPMVSMLFKQQEQWAAAENGREALLQMSKLAGFTQQSFEACLTNQKLLDDVNAVRERGAKEFGIAATPTFIVNGQRYSGEMSVAVMSALIDSKL
ncbi:protein-disulfide isomerase [Rhizobium azooxidifex]|uniref:Protein-disulfide isomerase n=1 Tax=Mycoplana azooxidifex TaxID=1636188 RepID=A0A7W6D784_9HYPH|nr:DsbA family protein [Mycoplana azooxidifex]MBB3975911.1 protein-disulfide isomerase [Mycoplana azooxidifex]